MITCSQPPFCFQVWRCTLRMPACKSVPLKEEPPPLMTSMTQTTTPWYRSYLPSPPPHLRAGPFQATYHALVLQPSASACCCACLSCGIIVAPTHKASEIFKESQNSLEPRPCGSACSHAQSQALALHSCSAVLMSPQINCASLCLTLSSHMAWVQLMCLYVHPLL